MVTRDILTTMNTLGAGINLDVFDRESQQKRYRAWGEYGPLAGQTVEVPAFLADDMASARAHALAQLTACYEWDRIGEHNMYVVEITR